MNILLSLIILQSYCTPDSALGMLQLNPGTIADKWPVKVVLLYGPTLTWGFWNFNRGGHCEIQHHYSSLSPLRLLPLAYLLLICPLYIYLLTLCRTVHMWKSEVNLLQQLLFFHHVGSEDWTQVIKLSSKYLYPRAMVPAHEALSSSYSYFLRHFHFFTCPAFHSSGAAQTPLQMHFSLISAELLKIPFAENTLCIYLA